MGHKTIFKVAHEKRGGQVSGITCCRLSTSRAVIERGWAKVQPLSECHRQLVKGRGLQSVGARSLQTPKRHKINA